MTRVSCVCQTSHICIAVGCIACRRSISQGTDRVNHLQATTHVDINNRHDWLSRTRVCIQPYPMGVRLWMKVSGCVLLMGIETRTVESYQTHCAARHESCHKNTTAWQHVGADIMMESLSGINKSCLVRVHVWCHYRHAMLQVGARLSHSSH